jgi:arginine/lysine/ornithine decarboxylase
MNRRTFLTAAGAGALALGIADPALAKLEPLEQLAVPAVPGASPCGGPQTPIGELKMRALIVDDELHSASVYGDAARKLVAELEGRAVAVLEAQTAPDAQALLAADPGIECLLVDWDLAGGHAGPTDLVAAARASNPDLPVFLLTDQESAATVPAAVLAATSGFVALLEDTTGFIGGRVVSAILRYRAGVLPPMFKALVEFAQAYEYSWHMPGHTGGTAFLKSPAGRAYFEFFGESLLRSDLSISVGELGSLLDHSGPIGEGERNAARIFGAHRTYYVTNGSSTSNRVILMASVTRNQVTLCDRNCHKSVEHSMTMSGAIPTYLVPSRNGYGIIGPILPQRLTADAVWQSIAANPLVTAEIDPTPVHAVITNSTYDGLCYNVARVEELLDASVDRLHFDEAWYGYARFHPLYRDRHAMHGDPSAHDANKPTVFATQSTHKLLAALSQASMIHVRDGRRPIAHERFNESYMMHASTSPLYPLLASIDVSAGMMDGAGGQALMTESIREAVDFRQMVSRLHAEHAAKGDWFFDAWQPPTAVDEDGKETPFYAADPELLVADPGAWVLRPDAPWHGFGPIEDGYCLLDPIKVSIVTPGGSATGGLAARGIPAAVVSAFLDAQGIVPEKTTDFTILFLFSLGITKGKWGTLINAFYDFKRHYDANTPLAAAIPSLAAAYGDRYAGMGLRDLCDAIFAAMRDLQTTKSMADAFSVLPEAKLSPVEAYERLVRNEVESLTLDAMAGRLAATGVVPYPPGIPLLMPGENAGQADGPFLRYLKALEAFDRQLPGFTHDTHGVEVQDGAYRVLCLK